MVKKDDGADGTPQSAAGRLTLVLQRIVIGVKRDLIVTFVLDGVEKVSTIDKNLYDDLSDVS